MADSRKIDVSSWQGTIPWDDVFKNNNIGAVYFRASYGKNKDPQYDNNRSALERLKIPFGVYHYANPSTGLTWQVQADFFAGLYCGNLPPILDAENNGATALLAEMSLSNGPKPMSAGHPTPEIQAALTSGLDKADLESWYYKFIQRYSQKVPQAKLGIYTAAWFWDAYMPLTDWAKHTMLWVAHYTTAPASDTVPIMPKDWTPPSNPKGFPYTFWQYSDKGSIIGIDGNVDQDRFRGTDAEFEKRFGVVIPKPAPVPGPVEFPHGMHFAAPNTVNVRTSPNASTTINIVGTLRYPAAPIAFEELVINSANKWIRIGSNLWCIQTLNGKEILSYD